jgi:NAD(P)-dependent dehydrogenase (short-subunit alcohol dehydrogenase family)
MHRRLKFLHRPTLSGRAHGIIASPVADLSRAHIHWRVLFMPSELFDLSGEVAVVIGATGVLGGAMADALAAHGASVAVVGRNPERGAARVQAIEQAGGKAVFQAADAMSQASLAEARDAINQQLGPVSILVSAAGGNRPEATLPPGADFCKLPKDAWNEVFDLNLVGGSLLPSQVFGETMVERQHGSIINIASMAGMIPLSRVVAYSSAKAAVINLTQFLAREWATKGVRVNAISPGFFPAEQNKALLFNEDGSYTERGGQIIGHTPMARFGSAEELAGTVVWLASSKAASFVTGQNIVVDGGFSSTTI